MATLAPTFQRIYSAVARYLGLNTATMSATELQMCMDAGNDGYRAALYPLDPRTNQGYTWSFLQPEATLDLYADRDLIPKTAGSGGTIGTSVATFVASMVGAEVTGTTTANVYEIAAYVSGKTAVLDSALVAGDTGGSCTISANGLFALPADFGSVLNDPSYGPNDIHGRLTPRSAAYLRGCYSGGGVTTGTPSAYTIVPLAFVAGTGQRYSMLVYPEPGADYTMQYQYQVEPVGMSADGDYPMGGQMFGALVMQAALSAAEQRENNRRGEQTDLYEKMLAAAIDADKRNKPQSLGPIEDPSDEMADWQRVLGDVEYP